jgi:hypothetical protein
MSKYKLLAISTKRDRKNLLQKWEDVSQHRGKNRRGSPGQ